MIGLDIKVENSWNSYLNKIFNGIDLMKYSWQIITDESIWNMEDVNQGLFEKKDMMGGEEFSRCISRDKYYLIFTDIKAFPTSSEIKEIETFNDFINSECELIFLCVDSQYFNFYSKDQAILDRVYSNCIGPEFEKVEYVSVEDAINRSFIAW